MIVNDITRPAVHLSVPSCIDLLFKCTRLRTRMHLRSCLDMFRHPN